MSPPSASAGSADTGLGRPRARADDEADDPELAAGPRLAGRDATAARAAAGARSLRDAALRLKALLDRPLASYYLVLGCALLLLGVGLMMVLSTSTAYDLDQGLPAYSMFEKQLLGAAVGLALMWLAAKSPPRLFRALAYPLLFAAVAGLVLVLKFGHEIDGAKRWLAVAGTQVQPSEFAKLALVLWGADLLARKEKLRQLTDWRHILVPLLPGAALMCMLVMIGKDLGTTFLLSVIFLSLLWVIGAPGKLIVGMVALMVFALLMLDRRALLRAGEDEQLPVLAVAELPQPDVLPAGPGQGRARFGRPVRRGQRCQPGQVGLGAQQPDGLHLRDPRRGTRPGRHAVRGHAVRRAGVRRPARRAPGAGHFRAAVPPARSRSG